MVPLLATALLVAALAQPASTTTSKPNIFLVLVDDFGWANVGYHREDREVQTPTINQLAKEGIKLDRHYVYNYCSPSRASLQTGRLPVHVSFMDDDPSIVNPADPVSGFAGIPRNMTGIAHKLREAGYRTHMTGKWDAGMATETHSPLGRGYESWLGYFHHAIDYITYGYGGNATALQRDVCAKNGMKFKDLWLNDRPASEYNNSDIYVEDLFTKNTLKVIQSHDPAEPLFLFHSFHIVHTPLEVPQAYEEPFSFIDNSDRRKYAAMVKYMDDALGKFVGAFKDKGMWDNTLMVLSSDNGGPIYGGNVDIPALGVKIGKAFGGANNLPLRGGKLSDWEGGIRVNAFVSGGAVPEPMRGQTLDNYVHIADWYSTFCAIAGVDAHDHDAEQAGLPPVDGVDQWPVLSGKVPADQGPREEMHISKNTLIKGDFKMIRGGFEAMHNTPALLRSLVPMDGYWQGYGSTAPFNTFTKMRNCHHGCLFNIRDDPYEKHDLAFHLLGSHALENTMEDGIVQLGAAPRLRRFNPEVLKVHREFHQRLDELNKGIFLPDRGESSMQACEAAQSNGGFYGPFVE